MKKFALTISGVFLLLGLLVAQGQHNLKNQNELKAFKQQLITESQTDFQNAFITNPSFGNYKTGFAISGYGNPPGLNWAGQFGGSGDDYSQDIVSDVEGNVYITGHFSGEISIGTSLFTSVGAYDAIIAKFNNTGDLLWLTQLSPSSDGFVKTYGICIDGSENIYVTGYYTGNVTFGNITLPNIADYNLFFAKLNNSGEVLMAKNHGDAEEIEIGLKIDTDENGNIYVLGSTNTQTGFRHPTIIIKFSSAGTITWEQAHDISFNDLVVNNSNIYYSGLWEGYHELDGIVFDPKGYGDAFVCKSDLDGNFIWAAFGDHEFEWNGDSYGEFLAVDENENIYLAGFFRSNVVFGNDTLYSSGYPNGFITKCSSSGNFLWAKLITSDRAEGVCVDITGHSYTAHSNQISKFDANGTEQWTEWMGNSPFAITINSSDKLLTTGNTDGLIFISQLDNAANEEWHLQFDGNSAYGHVIGLVTDNTNNIYTYGYVSNSLNYLGEELNKGIFICKQNSTGEILWLKNLAVDFMDYGSQGNFLNIDVANSCLYITGVFYDDLIIPGETTLVPVDGGSTFILKYSLDGDFIWLVQEDFNSNDPSVVPDNSGNIILSGVFTDEITIGTTGLISEGYLDGFVAKYDGNGSFLWAIRAGGESTEYLAIAESDDNDNIYLSGEFVSENVTIDDTEITLLEGDGNIIFAKLDPDGNVYWVKSFAASHHEWYDGYCWPTGILTDAEGNIFIKGSHTDSVYFDDILLTSPYYKYSKFIAKIDNDGNVIWVKSLNTYGGNYWYDYNQFDIDSEGNVYFGMQAKDTLDFGDEFQYIPAGASDLLVAKYTSSGSLEWVKAMQSDETSYNWISSVMEFGNENVMVGGFFNNYLLAETEELFSLNRHGFVIMFGEDMGVKEVYRNTVMFDVYPIPAKGVLNVVPKEITNNDITIKVYNPTGELIFSYSYKANEELKIDLSDYSKGLYMLSINYEGYLYSKKFIVQ